MYEKLINAGIEPKLAAKLAVYRRLQEQSMMNSRLINSIKDKVNINEPFSHDADTLIQAYNFGASLYNRKRIVAKSINKRYKN